MEQKVSIVVPVYNVEKYFLLCGLHRTCIKKCQRIPLFILEF